jgi:hypothetical protein
LIYVLKEKYPQYTDLLNNIEEGLNLRLWYQLSVDLINLSEKHELQEGSDLIEIYNLLVINIESTFNPMKLMIIVQNVVKNFKGI